MFQLQSRNHQAIYVRSIKGNLTSVIYIQLKMINGRHLSLTHKAYGSSTYKSIYDIKDIL